jgi:hypothetical protein
MSADYIDRFNKLIRGNQKSAAHLAVVAEHTEEEKLLKALDDVARNDSIFPTLDKWFDSLIKLARAQQRASLTNHPLMCHYDGQVAALESLKATLLSFRREGDSSPQQR